MARAIKTHAPKESKTALAARLGVSRSSLYYRLKLPSKDLKLKATIKQVMKDNKAYGHKRIAIDLGINKKRVLRVMRLFKLKPQRMRHRKPDKPEDKGNLPLSIPNLIENLVVDHFGQVWVVDFTYLWFAGVFVYLATVEDLFDRRIVGWAVSTRHNAKLVTNALLDALNKYPAPDIVHSDQGSEYASEENLDLLKAACIKPSMSDKASPWQNGYQESFYSEFKLELGDPNAYESLGQLAEAIASQIFYYNNKRIHSALKCSPAVFAKRCELTKNALNALKIINNSAENKKRILV
jgi:transposase InsO family protein